MFIIATPIDLPKDHTPYAMFEVESLQHAPTQAACEENINKLQYGLFKVNGHVIWQDISLDKPLPLDKLIIFTKETHPEYFI